MSPTAPTTLLPHCRGDVTGYLALATVTRLPHHVKGVGLAKGAGVARASTRPLLSSPLTLERDPVMLKDHGRDSHTLTSRSENSVAIPFSVSLMS